MALTSCPDCGRKISDAAPACIHCGRPRATIAEPEPVSAPARAEKGPWVDGKSTWRWWEKAIVAVGAVAAFAVCFGDPGPVSPSAAMATVDCEDFVEDRLKSPASADFADYDPAQVTELGGGRYRVRSWVDAENGFGANIRTAYTCTVRYDGDNVTLESLTGL